MAYLWGTALNCNFPVNYNQRSPEIQLNIPADFNRNFNQNLNLNQIATGKANL